MRAGLSRQRALPARAAPLVLALGVAALAPACALDGAAAELDGTGRDPFAGDDKGDGASFFGAVEVTIDLPEDGARGGGTLRVRVDGQRVKYRDVETSAWSRRDAGEVARVRLAEGDALASMRSFLLAKSDDPAHDPALLLSHLAEAAGACVPRARPVTVTVGGRPLGPHVLLEHVGDKLLDRCFDGAGAAVARTPDEIEDAAVWRARLAAAATEAGVPSVASVLDVDQAAGVVAAAHALGQTDVALALVALDRDRHAVVPELGSRAVTVAELAEALLVKHGLRESYAHALEDAAACLAAGSPCDAADRVAPASALARRETDLDAPDGDLAYAPFAREGDALVARFRNREPGLFAARVTLRLHDGRGEPEAIALAYDRAGDVWQATLVASGVLTYDYAVTDGSGDVHELADPTVAHRAPDTTRETVDLDTLDVLVPLRVVRLDVREPSGLERRHGELWVMGDEAGKIVRVHPMTGARLEAISLGVHGIEAIAVDPVTNDFLVADEDRGVILRFDETGHERDAMRFGWADDRSGGGLEGLTIRSTDGHVIFAKERSPARIAELDLDGELLVRERVSFAADVSAVAWSPDDGYLYALSDQEHTLYRLSDRFEVLAAWTLDVDKPEGLAIADGYVYVASDATGNLHTYDLNRARVLR